MFAANKNRRGRALCLRGQKAGFTVVELLVAIAVFAVAVPALVAGINNLIVLNNRTRDLALANLIAESKAELLRGSGFISLRTGTFDFTQELPAELAPPRSASYTITSPEPGLAQIVITISYRDYNQIRTNTYKTLVSELGVGQ